MTATPPESVTIVGGGQAAGRAFALLRQMASDLPITMVSAEDRLPYERPPLSKECLEAEAMAPPPAVVPPEVFDTPGSEVRLGTSVLAIEHAEKRIVLEDGSALSYERLLLATGARPRTLPLADIDDPRVITFRRAEDAARLHPLLGPGNHIVIVGGGAIGTEIAAMAATKGARVTVVEAGNRLLARCMNKRMSSYLQSLHEAKGVRILFGAGVASIADGTVGLVDGAGLDADAVVLAIGVVANDEIAANAGLAVDDGILVDGKCRTSDPDIYAVGDAARFHDPFLGRQVRAETWANANAQAEIAAAAMLGGEPASFPPPSFWTTQFGIHLQMYGDVLVEDAVLRATGAEDSFSLLHFDGERLVGATCANNPREFRALSRMVGEGRRLDRGVVDDPTVALNACMMDDAA